MIIKYIWKKEKLNPNFKNNYTIERLIIKKTYYEGWFLFGFIPLYIRQIQKEY